MKSYFLVHGAVACRYLTLIAAACGIGGMPNLAFAQVTSTANSQDQLEEIVVSATRRFLDATDASSTKLALPIVEIPQAVTIISRDVLDAIDARNFQDATRYVAGVDAAGTARSVRLRAISRGFQLSTFSGFKVNGHNIPQRGTVDLSAVERLEFIKGANALAFGQNSPGGFLNYVTKSPSGEPNAQFRAALGTDEFRRVGVDWDLGALGASERQRLRITGAYEESQFFERWSQNETSAVGLFYEVDLSEATTLELNVLTQSTRNTPHFGFSLLEDQVLPDLASDFSPTYPWAEATRDAFLGDFTLSHQLTDDIGLSVHGYSWDDNVESVTATPFGTVTEDGDVSMLMTSTKDNKPAHGFEARVGGDIQAFGQTHTFFVTGEYFFQEFFQRPFEIPNYSIFNYFNPDYFSVPKPDVSTSNFQQGFEQEGMAFSARTILRFMPSLHVHLGVRYDDLEDSTLNSLGIAIDPITTDNTSPQVAVVYSPWQPIHLFASYSESFEPQSGITCDGSTLPPLVGEQIEIGAKLALADQRVLLTVNAFDITLDNISEFVQCPGETSINSSEPVGENTSQGVEIELVGEPIPGLNIIASYSHLEAERSKSVQRPETIGQPLSNVPEDTASIYANYEFLEGSLRGFGVSGGVTYASEKAITVPTIGVLPSYHEVNLGLHYTGFEGVIVSLIGTNVTNEVGWDNLFGRSDIGGATRRAPERWTLSVEARF